jgi:uncharacterized membrane protein
MAEKKSRIEIIDGIRGFAIIAMVIYHAMYDINQIFNINLSFFGVNIFQVLSYLEPTFAGVFILLSGVSSRLSHSNLKRGLQLAGIAVLLTIGTIIYSNVSGDNESIYFGILHFIAAAILLFALLRPLLDKIPAYVSLPMWTVLFVVTFNIWSSYFIGIPGIFGFTLPSIITNNQYLFAIGIPSSNFFSADYFPLLPWIFIFLIGTVMGVYVKQRRLPEKFYTAKMPFFAFAGRYTLLIYIIHQPIVIVILYLIFDIILKK